MVARGRPGALRSAEIQDAPSSLIPAASGSHSALQPRSDRSEYNGDARTGHRRRLSRRKPAAVGGTCASRMHSIRNVQLACSQARPNMPAEATLCVESRASIWTRVYHPKMPDLERMFCTHSRPTPIRNQCKFKVGWVRLVRVMSLAPIISPDNLRSNARGRSDLHGAKDTWTSQTHDIPGIMQDRRGTKAAVSHFRQNGVSRLAATGRSGFLEQIDGIGWPCANLCIETRDPRDDARDRRAG